MARTFFTSDTHFGHANIIKFCSRPFKDIDRMNEVLINNWNARIKPDDFVIFVGDFVFRSSVHVTSYLKSLNGNKTMICGNHDHNNGLNTKIYSLSLSTKDGNFFVVHDPRHINRDYNINFVGHVHEAWKIRKIKWLDTGEETVFINVGVDVWKFYPVELRELVDYSRTAKSIEPENWSYQDWIKPYSKRVL